MKKLTLLAVMAWLTVLAWCGAKVNETPVSNSSSSEVTVSSDSSISSEESSISSEESSVMTWTTETMTGSVSSDSSLSSEESSVSSEESSTSVDANGAVNTTTPEGSVNVWADGTVKIWE